MEVSLFLAKVIGIYFIVISLFLLIRFKALAKIMREIADNSSLMFTIAIITLMVGILLVVSHNTWTWSWPVIITIISWLIFISGIVRLFLVTSARPIIEWWLKHTYVLKVISVIYLLLGLFLFFKGTGCI